MQPDLHQTTSLLARTPAALDALLRDLPAAWTSGNEGDGTWSVSDILGHLIHGERTDWIVRAKLILTSGETRPFDPFNRLAHLQQSRDTPLASLLDDFAHLRAQNLAELRSLNLQPAQLALRGTHPALGTVTLSQLLSTWAAHDLTHLHQISRVMAHQYREAVGPWSAFLGVLHCNGHSAAAPPPPVSS